MGPALQDKKDVLHMKTFGGFSLEWKGVQLLGGIKTRNSYFTNFMEAVLHSGKKGIGKKQLQDILFEDRDLSDAQHTMRIVIYDARKKLKSAGLPATEYFLSENGVIRWTDEIGIEEDAARMEQLYEAAEDEKDPDTRMQLYLEACRCYTGEFLPDQTRVIWVAQEDRRYQEIFCNCVNSAAALMRMNKDYNQLEMLGRHAVRVQPLAEWEPIIMEALIAMGRQDEARNFYEKTVDEYMEALGFRPSFSTIDLLDRLGAQMQHTHAMLDEIQLELTGAGENLAGGYICSYPVFRGAYRLIERMTERGGLSVYLMLCTIVDREGRIMKESEKLEQLTVKLGDAICHSVRHSDALCRYGTGQYLVLLINTSREDCDVVQKRINYHFLSGSRRMGVQYYVNSVIYSADDMQALLKEEDIQGKGN